MRGERREERVNEFIREGRGNTEKEKNKLTLYFAT